MSKADDAVSCFSRGFNCSQAVFSAFSEENGMSREDALKVACAFGAGMGRMGATCGAVTGAFMALGLKYGKYKEGDEAAKEKTYALVNEFAKRFKARNGTIVCKELLEGCDLATSEGAKTFKEQGFHAKRCTKYVRDAAEILEDLMK
ncbi:MAG: putative redox-active protein (C_GCAxxG_C_C) [Methanocella sp. PtaU1.Bin125]|nr:MAG: putative redox-active protein (C_GCAxxG_C_C) [Methanocella sp. PtaU1.Bin125]